MTFQPQFKLYLLEDGNLSATISGDNHEELVEIGRAWRCIYWRWLLGVASSPYRFLIRSVIN